MSHQEIQPDRVAIYIRWSTDDQSDGTTLAVQSEACRHYVQSQGWEVREDLIFIDDGYSGGSLERPALTKLRRLVKEGLIDCVVVFKLDRLSRSVIDTVTLVLQEWEDLTHLKSAREPVDTTTAMGKQFFYMLVSYAEWERNVIRERMFGGRLRRAKEGRSPGMPAPYGYCKGKSPGALEVVESEAHVVRIVFNLAERGTTVRQITLHLNQQRFPSRRGSPWGTSMVSKMLRNPIYSGQLVWGRRRINPRYGKAPGERRLKHADPHAVVPESQIPGIICMEQFERVQAVMAGNKKISPGASGSDHLLTGLIKCARCGRAMQYNGFNRWTYYRCGGRMQQKTCDAQSVPAPALERAILEELKARYVDRALEMVREQSSSFQTGGHAELEANLRLAEEQLTRLEARERRVNRDYLQESITPEERRQLLGQVLAEKAALIRQRDGLREQIKHLSALHEAQVRSVEVFRRAEAWDGLSASEQKQILRFFMTEVHVQRLDDGGIEAKLTWKDLPPARRG